MHVYLGNQRISLDPSQAIGKGGEADIYKIPGGKAVKIFKPPDHPDYQGLPHEQRAAVERIAAHQTKLREFPKGLPPRVITPEELVTDRTGSEILGYSMRLVSGAEVLLRFGERNFRSSIPNDTVVTVFRDLYPTVLALHKSKVVIGDFNDLNVLVTGTEGYLIDADSFQFGRYFCMLFTARFVDPLLCDPQGNSPMLVKPHSENSDWYAFAVMLMQSLLFVGPYGGVHVPKDPKKRIPHGARPLHRITVFHPEVRYPKPAIPFKVLPDDLLQKFHLIFEKDERGEFPLRILQEMRWTKCSQCGLEHARSVCPECAHAAPELIKAVTKVTGTVTATRIFQTSGLILFATSQEGKFYFLYNEDGKFKREDGKEVLTGKHDPMMRFRIKGRATLIARDGRVATLVPGEQPDIQSTDSFGSLPLFDANGSSRYWISNGQLQRDGIFGPQHMGDVLSGQTLFWVGPSFGFGFYRAGNLTVFFLFDAERPGINDTLKLSPVRGQLVDSTCVFTNEWCWFFVSTRQGSKTINRCTMIKRDGTIEGEAETEAGDGSWLGNLRGKLATGNFLLAATDEGIIRVEVLNGQVIKTREFPDTEPYVDSGVHLFPGPGGLYVVKQKEVWLLKLS